MKKINIAIACELAPAKTFIPIIKKIKELETEKSLKWDESKIIALTHGNGVEELINPYCDEIYPIGSGRGAGKVKRNNITLGYLIAKDIYKAISALNGKGIDLLLTCGNAGDVRKSIIAANILKIPIIHIEQDIYNPIEVIAYSNIITVPSEKYKEFLKETYFIDYENSNSNENPNTIENSRDNNSKNESIKYNSNDESRNYQTDHVENIHGYPMVTYVNDYVNTGKLMSKTKVDELYKTSGFILVVLGGDIRASDLKELIECIQKSDYPTLIVPYRFKKETIESLVSSSKIKVLDEPIDMLSLMKTTDLLIYGAGMGMTIESGVLKVPSIKIAGFHPQHGSVDLANQLKIPILSIHELSKLLEELKEYCLNDSNNIDTFINNNIRKPEGGKVIENGEIAVERIINIINNFDFKNPPKKSGFKSMKAIWNQRSKYR